MRRMPSRAVPLALITASLMAAPAGAQESTTRGFNAGLHVSGASLQVENGDRSNAGGAGIILGYGFNRTLELFLQLDGAEFDVANTDVDGTWTMGHADLGVRFHFANSLRSWVPYLQAALSGRAVSVSNPVINQVTQHQDVSITGGALSLGGGVMFYFNESLALDLQLAWSGGNFTQVHVGGTTVTLNNPIDAQSSRFNVGISWWP